MGYGLQYLQLFVASRCHQFFLTASRPLVILPRDCAPPKSGLLKCTAANQHCGVCNPTSLDAGGLWQPIRLFPRTPGLGWCDAGAPFGNSFSSAAAHRNEVTCKRLSSPYKEALLPSFHLGQHINLPPFLYLPLQDLIMADAEPRNIPPAGPDEEGKVEVDDFLSRMTNKNLSPWEPRSSQRVQGDLKQQDTADNPKQSQSAQPIAT